MKKFEIPEITISMFDKTVATDDSAVGKAKAALAGTDGGQVTQIGQAAWGSAQDWTISF